MIVYSCVCDEMLAIPSAALAMLPATPTPGSRRMEARTRAEPSPPATDFAAAYAAVAAAEKSSAKQAEPLRSALDALLAEWPLCYSYWKKCDRCHAHARTPRGGAGGAGRRFTQ